MPKLTLIVFAMDEDPGALGSGDNDNEGFITPPNSTSKDDTAQVGEEYLHGCSSSGIKLVH